MLRIITERWSALAELKRVGERFQETEIREKEALVGKIIDEVKLHGDRSLIDYTREYYQRELTEGTLKVSGAEMDAAYQQVSKELLKAIGVARDRLTTFHEQRLPKNRVHFNEDETVFGKRYHPLASVGIYIPDGEKSYLSPLLSGAIPARVARVERVIAVCPSSSIHPTLLVAAQEAGIKEIYRVGGPQAIAALAYGTETIEPVDMICGGGEWFVSLAKKLVSDRVKIDSCRHGYDLFIINDLKGNARRLALDMVAFAEQYPLASTVLLTTDKVLAQEVQEEVRKQLQVHPSRIQTEKAIAHYGFIIVVESVKKAIELVNSFTPSHLSLVVAKPWDLLPAIRGAGTIFLGYSTPKAFGDYFGGSSVSFSPHLTVEKFLRASTFLHSPPESLESFADTLQILARAEGFPASALAVEERNERE